MQGSKKAKIKRQKTKAFSRKDAKKSKKSIPCHSCVGRNLDVKLNNCNMFVNH
jgi:hypothetical protein